MSAVETIAADSDDAIVVTAEETLVPAAIANIVGFTRDLTLAAGAQAVTGLGFKPRAIIFTVGTIGSGNYASIAFADADAVGGMFINGALNGSTSAAGLTGSSGGNFQSFTVTSFDADGFTVTWAKSGSPTGTAQVQALCFR